MSLYEATFIIRQELSAPEVEKVANDFKEIATNAGGKIIKEENWGLRTLAYKINKSKKGHYVHLGLEANKEAINEISRKSRLSEDVMRNLIIKVDEISKDPSPILKESNKQTPRVKNA